MLIGYARVSTSDQNLDLQRRLPDGALRIVARGGKQDPPAIEPAAGLLL